MHVKRKYKGSGTFRLDLDSINSQHFQPLYSINKDMSSPLINHNIVEGPAIYSVTVPLPPLKEIFNPPIYIWTYYGALSLHILL